MKFGWRCLIFFICLITSSCLGGGRQLPDAVQVLGYDEDDISRRYKVDQQWWLLYDDAQLDRLMTLALDNNIDLLQSAVTVNRALYRANLLGADLAPEFSAAWDGSASRNIKSGDPSSVQFTGQVRVQYEIDLWRRLADSASAQEWEYRASRQDLLSARLALINNVTDTYFNIMYLRSAIEATGYALGYYEQIKELTQLKYDKGKVAYVEPAQAVQAVLASESNLLDWREQHKAAEQTMRDLLNLTPGDELTLTFVDMHEMKLPEVNLQVPLSVLAARPDVRAAEYRLQSAFKNVQAAEKSLYPTITVGAALSSSGERAAATFDLPFTGGTISISLPFLQYNRIKWEIAVSEADFESALLNFTQSVNTALNELDYYYYSYVSLRESLRKIEEKYDYDLKIAAYYQARYQAGAGELSDWLNALNTVMDSKISALRCRYQLLRQENMIYKALAGRYLEL
ncbi:MAG: TolC family protein [Desulfarculales bacterium]|jgi:outer membrane protein TolC|nr:TolC family protein [Desulfarculales bacterium]